MKRIALIVATIIVATSFAFAQKPNVNKAKNLAFPVETAPKFDEAKAIISEAIKHEETKNLAKTWFVGAEVYLESAIRAGQTEYIKKGEDALVAYEYLLKAAELDIMPNKRGKVKPKYTKDIAEKFVNYIYKQYHLVNYGQEKYRTEEYKNAYNAFAKHLEIADLPIVMNSKLPIVKDTLYYEIKFFSAHYAKSAGDTVKAIEIFESLKDKGYKENEVHHNIALIHQSTGDTAAYVAILEEGINKFPDEFYYLGSLINYYVIDTERPDMAKTYLEKAIAKEPNKAQYHIIMSRVLTELNDYDGAVSSIDKAIALEPNNHEAWNAKGSLIYNKAAELETKAGEERDYKKGDVILAEANKYYKESISFFEKAVELKQDQSEYLINLRRLYYRFMDDDKKYPKLYDKVDQLIKAL